MALQEFRGPPPEFASGRGGGRWEQVRVSSGWLRFRTASGTLGSAFRAESSTGVTHHITQPRNGEPATIFDADTSRRPDRSGRATARELFVWATEGQLGRPLRPGKPGRKREWPWKWVKCSQNPAILPGGGFPPKVPDSSRRIGTELGKLMGGQGATLLGRGEASLDGGLGPPRWGDA